LKYICWVPIIFFIQVFFYTFKLRKSSLQKKERKKEQYSNLFNKNMSKNEEFTSSETTQGQATHAFSADVTQMLKLVINSIYSNHEIFLRELISNASDALSKLRYQSLTDPSILAADPELKIRIHVDKANKTLTVSDTGIGMTKAELVDNLGTIARSGTKSFQEAIQNSSSGGSNTIKGDLSWIGQFGLGFYSGYLVADRVDCHSKHAADTRLQHVWSSDAGTSFSVDIDSTTTAGPNLYRDIPRGTDIVLHLKVDKEAEFLNVETLKQLVKKYSAYIAYPIELLFETSKEEPIAPEAESDTDIVADEPAAKPKTRTVQTSEWRVVNDVQPLWVRTPADVTHDEYARFYKTLANDWEEHVAVAHFHAEGAIEFRSMLFVPNRPPHDLFERKKERSNVKLHVRRVFITDQSNDLLPDYLGFVRGIVDAEDLPLNVSREMLQQSKIMRAIQKQLVKKAIGMLEEIAQDAAKYRTFYSAFSKSVSWGVHEDVANRERLSELLRYHSSYTEAGDGSKDQTSLKDYVARMPPSQKAIYYVTGESTVTVAQSPFLEKLLAKGYEVLYMVDNIDEFVVQQLKEYGGKKLVCASKEGLDLDLTDDEKRDKAEQDTLCGPLCARIKAVLADKVDKVLVSADHAVDSPCLLVTGAYGTSANLERIQRSQALGLAQATPMSWNRKTMEINPNHELVKTLLQMIATTEADPVDQFIWLLYENALLAAGYALNEPHKYVKRVYALMQMGLSIGAINQDRSTKTDETD